MSFPYGQAGIATSANGGSIAYRNVPDVAMEADFDNYNCDMDESSTGWAGTSFAAPRWAAYMALANQQAGLLGNNPWVSSTH
jgi:subtilase family serine protease